MAEHDVIFYVGGSEVVMADEDELMLNVLRCHLTY